jgi:hypothetical protein
MATTTAMLTLVSTDLLSDPLALSVSMEINAAGTTTGITKTTGLRRQTFANTNETQILEADDYTDNETSRLYIKNTSSTAGRYIDITLGSVGASAKIGRLYNGEWAFIPWANTADINLQVSNIDIVFEWTLLYQ